MKPRRTRDHVELARYNGDLPRIFDLAATWGGRDTTSIAESLLATLNRMLDLDFIYLHLDGTGHGFVQKGQAFGASDEEVAAGVAPWISDERAPSAQALIGGVALLVSPFQLGIATSMGLLGKLGKGTLTGLGGADVLAFDTALNAANNVDTITDFNVAADTVRLKNAIFTQIGGPGALTAAQFLANAAGAAVDANDRIISETDPRKFFYYSNGSAAGGSSHFTTIAGSLSLTNADFNVI